MNRLMYKPLTFGVILALSSSAFATEFKSDVFVYNDPVTPATGVGGLEIYGEHNYQFNQGGSLNRLWIQYENTSITISTAENTELSFGKGSNADGLEVSSGADLTLNGGRFLVGTDSVSSEDSALNVRNNGHLTITAQSYQGVAGNESAFKIMSEYDGRGTQVIANLTEDFILRSGGTGIAIEASRNGGTAKAEINARNINISTATGDDYERQGGVYALAYYDTSETADIDLIAKKDISISGFKYGIAAYGDVDTFVQADRVFLAGDENNDTSRGIYYRGYNKENSKANITANELIQISGQKSGIETLQSASVTVSAPTVYINSQKRGIDAQSASQVSVNATNQLSINSQYEPDRIALYASDLNSSIKINQDAENVPLVTINGGIVSENKASIMANLGQHSAFTGYTSAQKDGVINLNFHSESRWTLTDDSTLSLLEMQDSTLDFSSYQHSQSIALSRSSRAYRTLTTDTFKGSGNNFFMHIDLANESTENVFTDQLKITGSATGTNTVTIAFDGNSVVNKYHSDNWLISQGTGSDLTITSPDGGNKYAPNGGITWWSLKFVENGTDINDLTTEDWNNLGNTGVGEGKWYLVQTDDPSTGDDSGEHTSPEAQQIQNLGSSVAQAVGWLSEKNDLRRRLGEVRYGSQAGAWAKVFTRQDRAEGFRYNGFKQESTGIHIGYDTFATKNEDAAWLVGATFRYAQSKQEGIETAYGGDGKLNEYSAKIYATWMHESGSYMDILAQVGYYDQEINGLNNVGDGSFDANYHNWGYGASVEIGHMFTIANASDDRPWYNHWFIEPQLELSYFYVKGEDFKTSTGLEVSQGNADFLTGRAGLVIGKKVNYGTTNDLDKRWYQVGVIGGVTHEFLGDQTIKFTGTEGKSAEVKGHGLGGTSFYYGVTADWQINDSVRIYGEISREEGQHYTKDYGVNLGLKYSF